MDRQRTKISRRAAAWAVVLALVTGLSGCGYTLQHRLKPVFAPARDGIFVPVFTNRTDEVGAAPIFTNALIRELQSRGQMRLVPRSDASVELWGEILEIEYAPTAYTEPGFQGLQSYRRLPTEIGVSVRIHLSLRDRASQRVLWKRSFQGFRRVVTQVERTSNYAAVSSLGLLTQSIINASYPEIADILMRDVYDEMLEVF